MKEWRDTNYYVTEDGIVWRYFPKWERDYLVTGRNGKPYIQKKRIPERWSLRKTQYNRNNGRPCVTLSTNGKTKNIDIHRMVAEIYCPGYFEGAHVDHIDCNVINNHYTNLQWCTPEYNLKKRDNQDYPLFKL